MKRTLIALSCLVLFAIPAYGQGGIRNDNVLRADGRPAVGATVRVCTEAASGTPCSPTASIWSDKALTISKTNPIAVDAAGGYTYYASPGFYKEQLCLGGTCVTRTVLMPPDVGNFIAGAIAVGTEAVTFSATPIFDSSANTYFSMTLTGNVTSSTISNAFDGRIIYFNICQDATGGRTFVWPATVLTPPTVGTLASSCTSASFIYDGTNWRELAASSRGSITFDALVPTATGKGIGTASARPNARLEEVDAGRVEDIRYIGSDKYAATSAGIQAAIDEATDGTIIQLPCNNTATDPLLISTTITVNKAVVLQGCGKNVGGIVASRIGSHLRQPDNSNLASLLTITEASVVLRDFTIDGNKANNATALDNITVRVGQLRIDNVASIAAKRNAIRFTPSGSNSLQSLKITNSSFSESDAEGMYLAAAGGFFVNDMWLVNVEAVNNASHQLYCDGCGGLRISNSDFSGLSGTGAGDGIFLENASATVNFFTLIGSHLVNNDHHAIRLLGINVCQIVGNFINNPGQTTTNTYDGIHISNFGGCKITGNEITDGQGTPTMRDAIRIASSTVRNVIEGNRTLGQNGLAYNIAGDDDASFGALQFSGASNGTVAAASTVFLGAGGQSSTEEDVHYLMGWYNIAVRLKAHSVAAPGAGETFIYTLRVDGVDKAMTCTISGASSFGCGDETNPVSINRDSRLTLKLVTSAAAAATRHRWSLVTLP